MEWLSGCSWTKTHLQPSYEELEVQQDCSYASTTAKPFWIFCQAMINLGFANLETLNEVTVPQNKNPEKSPSTHVIFITDPDLTFTLMDNRLLQNARV